MRLFFRHFCPLLTAKKCGQSLLTVVRCLLTKKTNKYEITLRTWLQW